MPTEKINEIVFLAATEGMETPEPTHYRLMSEYSYKVQNTDGNPLIFTKHVSVAKEIWYTMTHSFSKEI